MDREGVAIYKANNGTGYIVVSDQQANQFQIFPREGTPGNPHDHPLIKIVKGQSRLTDGCDVTSVSLPPFFQNGLFVAMSEEKNFHYYGWEDFAGNDLTNRPFPFVKFPSQVAIVTPSNNATVHSNESVTIATGYNNPRPRLYWLKRQEAIPDGSWSIVLDELFWATCGKWQRRLAAERTEPRRLCHYAKRSHEGRGGGRASKRACLCVIARRQVD